MASMGAKGRVSGQWLSLRSRRECFRRPITVQSIVLLPVPTPGAAAARPAALYMVVESIIYATYNIYST